MCVWVWVYACVLICDVDFFEKMYGNSNFRKIWTIALKLNLNVLYNFGIEFGRNRLKRSIFFKFWIFGEFSEDCIT